MLGRSLGGVRAARVAFALVGLLLAHPATGGGNAGGARQLGLDEVREAARAASPDLAAARGAVTVARGEERQAGAFLNPSVAYAHEQTSRSGETNLQDIALIEQPLEIGGQRSLRQEGARLLREASEAQLRAAELALDFEVVRVYAQAVAADRKAVYAEEVASAFARARAIGAERRKRGDISGYENRRTALEAARYAALRADAERERRSARALLASFLVPSLERTRVVEAPLENSIATPPLDADLEQLRARALATHPDIRAAELVHRAEQAEARLARRELVPDPTFAAGYKREEVADDRGDFQGFVAGVSMPLPLWDRRGGAVEAAEAEARRGQAEVTRIRRRVVLEVERAWSELRAASDQLAALSPELGPESEAALLAAGAAYQEGEIALVEWLDAVRAYYEVESTYADLLADHWIRRAALERAVGGSLF